MVWGGDTVSLGWQGDAVQLPEHLLSSILCEDLEVAGALSGTLQWQARQSLVKWERPEPQDDPRKYLISFPSNSVVPCFTQTWYLGMFTHEGRTAGKGVGTVREEKCVLSPEQGCAEDLSSGGVRGSLPAGQA